MNTHTTPKHKDSPNSTLDWIESPIPVPGYKASTKYIGWHWRKKDDIPTPAPTTRGTLVPMETYEVKDADGNPTELVRRFEYVVHSDITPQVDAVQTVEVDTLPAPTPVYNPEPEERQSYRLSAGEILDKVTGTKVSWETLPNGKRVRHGDMVLIGDPTTSLCGLVFAAHLRDLCKVWGRAQELTLVCFADRLELYPHTPDLMPNKITLNWRVYDPKYEHAIIKLTQP